MAGNDTELEPMVIGILFDPQVRQYCAQFLEPWMFQRTIHSQLVETLISKNFRDGVIDMRVLRLYMQQKYKDIYSHDWEIVEKLFSGYDPIKSEDITSVTNILSDFIKHRFFLKGVDLYAKGDTRAAEHCFSKAASVSILPDPFINPLQEGMLEHLKVKDLPKGGKVIRSSLGIINSSLLYKGYKSGDLAMVVMRPKAGKSTLMCQEAAAAADQGFKVAHMFFGDFTEFDGLCKFMSCVTGDLISNVVNAPEFYKKKCESWLENWRVAAFPAFALDCHEIVSYAKNYRKKFEFDLLVIDYDSNVRPPQDAGMYESGGVMYSTFKGFGQQEGPVVMIGCQPKINFWEKEVLDFDSAAESSRKQHVVDIMITGGRNEKYRQIGTIHLPLVRRGESAVTQKVKFDDLHSRITEISPTDYESLLRDNSKAHKEAGDFRLEGVTFKDKPQRTETSGHT
jgi:hypothetical protein